MQVTVPERMTVEAIQTHYKNYYTRSRLEARYMVFFDTLGVEFRYEPEGFRAADGTMYLPDFFLPKQACWIEVKGQLPTPDEEKKAWMLAQHTKQKVYIFFGDIYLPIELCKAHEEYDGAYLYGPEGQWENFQWFYVCSLCGRVGIELFGMSVVSECGCPVLSVRANDYNPKLKAAYTAARQARFDGKDEEKGNAVA